MIKNISTADYKNYVENYVPFAWDKHENDPRTDTRNKHSLLIGYKRFNKIVQYIQKINTPIKSIIDVGTFPGVLVSILRNLFEIDADYLGIGLGFSNKYKEQMSNLNVSIFETDIDPYFIEPKECKEWPKKNADVCFLTDAIEHLTNPIFCLDQINKSLKIGGHLIITTDNISCLGYVYRMLRSGLSPNVHPVDSSVFYRGDWRPHFREYSKDELLFYLKYCGFNVIKHEYFERKQGDFYLNNKNQLVEMSRYNGFKGRVAKLVVKYFDHLRDHQILIAEKISNFDDIITQRVKPTHSIDEWNQMRADADIF